MKVLFIEDDAEIGEFVCDNLERLGHQYAWAKDGESLIKIVVEFGITHFDFVLSDIHVPGYNFTHMIETCSRANVPLLAQSSTSSRKHKYQMRKALDINELNRMITVTMEQR